MNPFGEDAMVEISVIGRPPPGVKRVILPLTVSIRVVASLAAIFNQPT